jgi:hemolysin III
MSTLAVKSKKLPLHRHHVRLRHHIRIRRRLDHNLPLLFKRTISAQIHAWAAFGSLAALVALAGLTYSSGWARVLCVSIFSASAALLFTASAILHFCTDGYRISKIFERLLENTDKFFIHILIAGTYTAVIDISLVDPLKTNMLIAVWSVGTLGILYTMTYSHLPKIFQSRILYTGQFLAMGWLIVFCFDEIMAALTQNQIAWTFTGGGLYSMGALIYAFESPNPTKYFGYHEIWHALVVLGCACFFKVMFLQYL